MVIALVESSFRPSLVPNAIVLDCKWDCNGTHIYSSVICDPDAPMDINLWNDMLTQVATWARSRKRQYGEIVELRELASAQRGEGSTSHHEPSQETTR